MKRFLTSLAALVTAIGVFTECKPYDDAWIREELSEMKEQIANLQKSISALDAYKTLLDKSRLISEVKDHGDGTFTIYFADGTAPVTLDAGRGEKGQDGVTPDFRIEDGDWFVSYDGGVTWTRLGSASGGDNFFQGVSLQGDYLVLVLIDGTEVRINLKGGGGGEDPGPGGDTTKYTVSDWLGDWNYDNAWDILFSEYDGKVYLNWADDEGIYVQIPFTFEESTGNLLLYMPQYRSIGGNYDSATGTGIGYYLNLYDKSGNRISNTVGDPDEGTLIMTLSLDEGGQTASITSADPDNYEYFFARPYAWGGDGWGKSKFYMYCRGNSTLKRTDGGGTTPDSGITYRTSTTFKFQYYSGWLYVNAASGNYAFWTVPASSGSLSDESFVKSTLDGFGVKLAAGSDGSVDSSTNTSTKAFQIFSGQSRYTTAPYYCNNGKGDDGNQYHVFMAGVSLDDGIKLTGEYAAITITWE